MRYELCEYEWGIIKLQSVGFYDCMNFACQSASRAPHLLLRSITAAASLKHDRPEDFPPD